MFRIDVASAAAALPAPAAPGTGGYFSNGNPATNVPSTIVDQDWLNSVQEELVNIAVSQGASLAKGTRNQCLVAIQAMVAGGASATAIQAQAPNYAVGGGTANAVTATFTPAISAHLVGAPLRVKILVTNTGPTTFNPGPGAVAVKANDNSALVGGELIAGAIAEFTYDGAAYLMKIIKASATQIGVSRFATAAELKAGALATGGVTPAVLVGAMFESAELAITNSADTPVAHGLGTAKRVQAWLRCKTAELGYSVGDEYLINPSQDTGIHGIATYISGANVGFVVSTNPVLIYKRSATIGDSQGITNGNWRVVLRASNF